jgi:hypothetical protein
MGLGVNHLRDQLGNEQGTVYAYVITTVKNVDGKFIQKGSGPNFQGGRITLCTCKHLMRSALDVEAWRGNWVAGFCRINEGGGRNALVCLMRVERAFASHAELWQWAEMAQTTKQAKAAHLHRLGDVFKPNGEPADCFDSNCYLLPVDDHVHSPDAWHKDIHYEKGYSGRPAALLVGDPVFSFLWDRPAIFAAERMGRPYHTLDLSNFLNDFLRAI